MTPTQVIEQAKEALEDSVGLVTHEYESNWRHGIPSRASQLNALKESLERHNKSITNLHTLLAEMEKSEPVAWMSPGKERLEFSRKDTVYGSHTLPLYKHPVVSQYSVGVIDADGYLYPDHPLEPGTVLYTTPQLPQKAGWQPIETAPQDGTVFLGYRGGKVREACRVPRDDCEMWVFGGSSGSVEIAPQLKPTHWMPLPAAPKPTENE